jgi:hypothetical protein
MAQDFSRVLADLVCDREKQGDTPPIRSLDGQRDIELAQPLSQRSKSGSWWMETMGHR